VAFGHIEKIGKRVLIIGVGNTAMDCCRTSLRLGAESVKVMARKPRGFFKASEWELEDAEEESVGIIINRAPRAFVIENGRLTGMRFDRMEYELDAQGRISAERSAGEEFLPADDVILAIGQETPSPGSSAIWGSSSTNGTCRWSTRRRFNRRAPGCSSAAMPRLGRRTSSGRSSRATRPPSPFTVTATERR